MSIQAIAKNYQQDKLSNIIDDYKFVRSKIEQNQDNQTTPKWAGDIVTEAKDNDHLCAKALISMAVLNGPTDVNDLYSALK